MKRILLSTFAVSALLAAACSKDPPPPQTPATQDPYAAQGQYPQQQQGQYPQQQGQYPQQQQGQYPQQPATTQPGVAPAGAPMATPGPLALPCQNDAACGLAKCNVQFQKCAFPCQNTAADCAPGNSCNTASGLCLPGQH